MAGQSTITAAVHSNSESAHHDLDQGIWHCKRLVAATGQPLVLRLQPECQMRNTVTEQRSVHYQRCRQQAWHESVLQVEVRA